LHIWWYKSLFHVELGQYDAALQIYDGPLLATMRPASMRICNGAALLWRLDMLGCEVGDRWQQLTAKWEGHADGKFYDLPDIHAAMSDLRAGSPQQLIASWPALGHGGWHPSLPIRSP
jgi:hypothetical protein